MMDTGLSLKQARKYIVEENQYYAKSGRINYFDLVIEKGAGSKLYDIDGNEYIDLLASASAINVGHSHPRVIQAMKEQMDQLIHYTPAYFHHTQLLDLVKKLVAVTPGDFPKKVSFGNSGSDANDGIIKFARGYTNRSTIVTFTGAYHGSTYGSMTASSCSLNMRRKMGPMLADIVHLPYPDTYRRNEGETDDELADRYLAQIKLAFETYLPPDEVACVLIEAIQGDGGIIIPPKKFIQELYQMCQDYGIVFAVDEVNQGLGRTGKMWSIDHFDVEPDLISIGKSIASGMPLSAIVGREEIIDSLEAPAHLFTTAANPVCCAASLATLDVLEEEGLVEKSRVDGLYVENRFKEMQSEFDCIGDVRLLGLNGGIEIVESQANKVADNDAATQIITYCFHHGVVMITLAGNILRFQPPLVISREELARALDVIEAAFSELEQGHLNFEASGKIGW